MATATASAPPPPQKARDRKCAEWMGDLGRQATFRLVWKVTKSDPVMKADVQAKVADLWRELAGANPSVLETLLVRRVLNGWLLTHAVAIELALAADPKTQDRIDRLLARVRRLQAPAVLTRQQHRSVG